MRSGYNDLFNDSDIDKTVLNWIVGIFLSIFFLIILGTIYFEEKAGACTSDKKAFFQFEFNGPIIRTAKTKGQGDKIIVNDHGLEKTFYFDYKQLKEVHPNDILIKKKNESNFILISQGDTSFYKENIPDCAQFVKQ
jgi:hypothetical protein